MKKIIYTGCLALLGLFVSCDDYLESPSESTFDESVVFSQPALTENMIFNIYSWFASTNSLRGRFNPYYGMNTDIEIFNSTEANDLLALMDYGASSANSYMSGTKDPNPWGCFYYGIEAANVCIKGIKKYGDPQPGTVMGYFYGEAIALRAIYYYDLLRAWGDVPARFEPVTDETIYLKKANRDEIYKQLISDLGEIQDYIPWPNESERTSTVERINKAFVKGFRARLCLMAAGYGQRPLDVENDHVSSSVRKSYDPELQVAVLYPIAKKELEEVIESGTCTFEPNFVDIFKKNCQDVIVAGGESVFEIPFAAGRGRVMQHFAV